jgi:ribulose-phosphate 3-epimerase
MIHIAPSILAADFARLGEEVRATEEAGAQRIHIDVMDGHFVPNLSMGPEVVKALRPITRLPREVHLMINNPAKFVEPFVKAGADSLIVHHEVLPDPRPVFAQIRAAGARVGLAVNPDGPVSAWEPHLGEIDVALCMTVFPGFAGQKFVAGSPERIAELRRLIDRINPRCELEVDGGINEQTATASVRAGANVLVMASALFGAADGPAAALRRVRALVEQE